VIPSLVASNSGNGERIGRPEATEYRVIAGREGRRILYLEERRGNEALEIKGG
jgi:hypothetical protein